MERILKISMCRKPLHKLSERQKRRIRAEYRHNVRSLLLRSDVYSRRTDFQNSSIPVCMVNSEIRCTKMLNISENNDIPSLCLSGVSSSDSDVNNENHEHHETDNSDNSNYCRDAADNISFSKQLASCFTDHNFTHVQGNAILSLLRTHECFSFLPQDIRTLLNTPQRCLDISSVPPGEYLHFDLERTIINCLSTILSASFNEIVLDISTDGCNLDRQSINQIWPIQCRICNVQNAPIMVVGIYKGPHKPEDPNMFFDKFVKDVQRILSNGGIHFNGRTVPLNLRCFIADAPAQAFILNHRNHMSERPCSKCKVSGVQLETARNYVYPGINHCRRTNKEYVECLDDIHHKAGTSPLSVLPIGMVSHVPFEYMHLVCIGVMKKLLLGWVHGKYSRETKLSGTSITILNQRIQCLQQYCPSDFARRPRTIDKCSKYKATELRQLLLYTAPALFHDILSETVYVHFLFLHIAIRILASKSPSRRYLRFAEHALQKFVLRAEVFYGPTFVSYNVHGLLHLTDDVRILGNLDSFSAFAYESNMSIFRKYCRKGNQPLQQIFNRIIENQAHESRKALIVEQSVRVFMPYRNDANCLRYRKIKFQHILLGIRQRDNCCILNDGSVCIVIEIINDGDCYRLGVRKFLEVRNLYDVAISSSNLHIYTCAALTDEVSYIHLHDVYAKGYRMPYWSNTTDNTDSDDSTAYVSHTSRYVVVAILHEIGMG